MDDTSQVDELQPQQLDVTAYLKRIGCTNVSGLNADALRRIQEQHMLHVPFENLDISLSRKIRLDTASLFDKIVERRRGGYCYELNGLLAWALDELGFQVALLSAQVCRDDDTYGPEHDHLVLLVQLDRDYIVDVGFGDSVRSPLPLSGEIVRDVSGVYRIHRDTTSDMYYFQKMTDDGAWVSEFKFTLAEHSLRDFYEMNAYQQTSPESHFSQNTIVSIAVANGRRTISGDTFIETVGVEKTRVPIRSNEERKELLRRHFGIEL